MASKNIIALPSLMDLEREAKRNGTERALAASSKAYLGAQAQIEAAHERMAWAALAIVRPQDFRAIDVERRTVIHAANRKAKEAARAFFTEECIGFRSEQ